MLFCFCFLLGGNLKFGAINIILEQKGVILSIFFLNPWFTLINESAGNHLTPLTGPDAV